MNALIPPWLGAPVAVCSSELWGPAGVCDLPCHKTSYVESVTKLVMWKVRSGI